MLPLKHLKITFSTQELPIWQKESKPQRMQNKLNPQATNLWFNIRKINLKQFIYSNKML